MGSIRQILQIFLFYVIVELIQAGFTTTKISPQPLWNSTVTDKLRQDLLLNYDKFARPSQPSDKTTVEIGISIKHIEINEFKSTLTLHVWTTLSWYDDKLKWNSSDYDGLNTLNLAEHEIWQPDISLYNSASTNQINHYGSSHCNVRSDGYVLWVPQAQFTVLCNLNLLYWPFDEQQCILRLGSWSYHGDLIDVSLRDNSTQPQMNLLVDNSEWIIKEAVQIKKVTYYKCCKEPFPEFNLNLTVKRNSSSYKALIITPAFVIIILTLLSFWLPPQSGEKILLNGFTAVIISLFMLYFTQKLPAMGAYTPLIVMFYSSCLYMVAFSMVTSIIVLWLAKTQHSQPLPWLIKQGLTGKLGKLLALNSYIEQASMSTHRITAEEMKDHQVTDFDEHSNSDEHHIIQSSIKVPVQLDWILLAAAIDRLTFCFYCFLFAILSIVYSV